ncbi:hypothetical protein HN51_025898, partial [Arachis hypogaea]
AKRAVFAGARTLSRTKAKSCHHWSWAFWHVNYSGTLRSRTRVPEKYTGVAEADFLIKVEDFFRGCYFQQGMEVKMEMKVEDAYRKSMETVLNWIQDTVNLNKSQVFFRTYTPVHFRSGDWRSGGSCHLETLPELNMSLVPNDN